VKYLQCLPRIRHQDRRIARSSRTKTFLENVPGTLLHRRKHIQDRVPLPAADIECCAFPAADHILKRQNVSSRQIIDVDIISYAGSVS